MSALLLCTDLDRTLIPNGLQPESAGARDHFARVADHDEVHLAYVTGRHLALVEEAIREWRLPVPGFLITDVGTTIWRLERNPDSESADWQRDEAWENNIGADWCGHRTEDLADLCIGLEGLQLQETARQGPFKLSYTLPIAASSGAASRRLASQLHERLAPRGIEARFVFSSDEVAGEGLLDVLPHRASKEHAIEALMERLEISRKQTLFSGDSGNDLEVLTSAIPAVLVANAQQAVRDEAVATAQQRGFPDALYLARGGYAGMNGNYAAGILEGLAHYHPARAEALLGLPP